MENHNRMKKIAVINDMSGFGKCSITVELPIISAMGIQCCPLPTAIFSNHTGYESFFMEDGTDKMKKYWKEWQKLDLEFEGICTGFLASKQQVKEVEAFLKQFKKNNTIVVIDPIMGDYGELYPAYERETGEELRKLLPQAEIVTPNLTEACVLAGEAYAKQMSADAIISLAEKIARLGPDKVAITGIEREGRIANLCFEQGKEPVWIESEKIGISRAGTGDMFCAMLATDAVKGMEFTQSVQHAAEFITLCIKRTAELEIPEQDGVCFEEFLGVLAGGNLHS